MALGQATASVATPSNLGNHAQNVLDAPVIFCYLRLERPDLRYALFELLIQVKQLHLQRLQCLLCDLLLALKLVNLDAEPAGADHGHSDVYK